MHLHYRQTASDTVPLSENGRYHVYTIQKTILKRQLDLPEKYYNDWQDMLEQDLLAIGVLSDPNMVATYDRGGCIQTECMVALSDGYGLNKMATALHLRPGQLASLYLSSYRGVKLAKNWSKDELTFLKCAID